MYRANYYAILSKGLEYAQVLVSMVEAGGMAVRYDYRNDLEWIHSRVPASLLLTPNLDSGHSSTLHVLYG